MRNVLRNSSEVMHIFAQRSQHCGKCGNVFFEQNVLYSYGHHFPMAVFHDKKVKFRKGWKITADTDKTIVLINSRKYSNTTAKHLSEARSALSQYTQIECPAPMAENKDDHAKNLAYFKDQIETNSRRMIAARKYAELYRQDAELNAQNGNAYIAFFGLKAKKFTTVLSTKDEKKLQKQIERYRETLREERKKKEVELKTKIEDWIAGKSLGWLYTEYQYFRLKGEQVETSKGVTFPLTHALLALRKIRQCVATKTAWHRNGEEVRVGTFHIDEIDAKGNVRAGCHKVKYSEIERFAKSINK